MELTILNLELPRNVSNLLKRLRLKLDLLFGQFNPQYIFTLKHNAIVILHFMSVKCKMEIENKRIVEYVHMFILNKIICSYKDTYIDNEVKMIY